MAALILFALAAACNAIMDICAYHWHKSIFQDLKREWWDGTVSWRNKYNYGDPEMGRNDKIVQLSDAWHFFKMLMIVFICAGFAVYKPLMPFYLDFVLFGFTWNFVFSLLYNKVLRVKE